MEIILNNTPTTIQASEMSIAELLEYMKFSFRLLAVRINDQPVKRDEYAAAFFKDGDKVDVIHMISGG